MIDHKLPCCRQRWQERVDSQHTSRESERVLCLCSRQLLPYVKWCIHIFCSGLCWHVLSAASLCMFFHPPIHLPLFCGTIFLCVRERKARCESERSHSLNVQWETLFFLTDRGMSFISMLRRSLSPSLSPARSRRCEWRSRWHFYRFVTSLSLSPSFYNTPRRVVSFRCSLCPQPRQYPPCPKEIHSQHPQEFLHLYSQFRALAWSLYSQTIMILTNPAWFMLTAAAAAACSPSALLGSSLVGPLPPRACARIRPRSRFM